MCGVSGLRRSDEHERYSEDSNCAPCDPLWLARATKGGYIKGFRKSAMPVAIDTLKATQRLKAAGFSDNQTKSLVATFAWGITENLATKDDIALVHKEMEVLGKDIDALDAKIDTSFAALDIKIDTSNAAVQKDIKALDTKIDASIDKLRNGMTFRLAGIMVGVITALKVFENFVAN